MIIAGTGHRPKYMPGQYDELDNWQVNLKLRLTAQLIQDSPKLVISGGALGFDIFLAEAAIGAEIPFDLYLPFKGTGSNWPEASQKRLSNLKNKARRVVYTSWEYSKSCFHVRDYAMVDDANLIYSCLNPEFTSGGTFATVKYANKKNKNIKNFWK